jgi:deazaflavin-dependent oxidoreductase (nitroreductase family)
MPESRVNAATPWLVKNVINPLMLLTGGLPILTARGRRTDRPIRTPINVQDLNGVHYITSPRGETGWSRNLRASGDCELKIKGTSRRCRATEVPPAERGPIIAPISRSGAIGRAMSSRSFQILSTTQRFAWTRFHSCQPARSERIGPQPRHVILERSEGSATCEGRLNRGLVSA